MKQVSKGKPIPDIRKSLLVAINGSVHSRIFRKDYFTIKGKSIDVLENGNLSCAFYVSFMLRAFGLMKELHTTVNATEKDLILSGWKKIPKPRLSSVIIYAPKTFRSGSTHRHVGFYIGKGKVVDNASSKGYPVIHEWDYRPIQSIWWHAALS